VGINSDFLITALFSGCEQALPSTSRKPCCLKPLSFPACYCLLTRAAGVTTPCSPLSA